MLPVLLDLGFIKIYTYGVFLLLSFFWASYFLWKNVLLTSYQEETIFDGVFWGIFGGLLLGRVEFVILHFSDYSWDILKFILVNGYPGIGFLGFIVGFLTFFALVLKRQDVESNKILDCVVAPLMLAIAIGKLGGFFSGTEIGTQTTLPVALIYQNLDGARHLTSLYESILYFFGAYLAHQVFKAIRRDDLSTGFNSYFFIFYVSLIVVLFDNLKSFRVILPILSVSFDFIVSSLLLLVTVIYFLYFFRKRITKTFSQIWSKIHISRKKD